MGTPVHIRIQQYLLPKYNKRILFYRRQIDDILAFWIDDPNSTLTFEQFKQDLNNQMSLDWDTENLSNQWNFLDLTVSIDKQGKITTKGFQKEIKLFYIPASTAHPPKQVESIIYGLLWTYYLQNAHESDLTYISQQFFIRLQRRGFQPHYLKPISTNPSVRY